MQLWQYKSHSPIDALCDYRGWSGYKLKFRNAAIFWVLNGGHSVCLIGFRQTISWANSKVPIDARNIDSRKSRARQIHSSNQAEGLFHHPHHDTPVFIVVWSLFVHKSAENQCIQSRWKFIRYVREYEFMRHGDFDESYEQSTNANWESSNKFYAALQNQSCTARYKSLCASIEVVGTIYFVSVLRVLYFAANTVLFDCQ